MSEESKTRICPQCGAALGSGAVQGLCPRCLMQQAMATMPTDPAGGDESAARSGEATGFHGFEPPAPHELAAHFPQLEIIELLGRGGMGAVYMAKQRGLDRLVALKILPPDVGDRPGFADRFTREARALAKLNHPNIVAVYDFGKTKPVPVEARPSLHAGEQTGARKDSASSTLPQPLPESEAGRSAAQSPVVKGLFYFLMEYVDGANLRALVKAKTLTSKEALAIVPQICEALQFAHDEGVVHRDIKPENILVDTRGRVKIADFGLAKLMGAADNVTLTRNGGTMGTPHYMAPEQLKHAHDVDHRADIYSLGVVFYEMLTGELPVGRFAPPSKKVRVDVRLDEVVLRSLEQEPTLRYQHVSEVKTQVDEIRGLTPQMYEGLRKVAGREYKSKAHIFGLPLLHVATGVDPRTGKHRVAKGVIAMGDVAVGGIACGGAACGVIAFGGLALGLISWGGLALGLILATGGVALGGFAFGGVAIGAVAIGGVAVGVYAGGGVALGIHALGMSGGDQQPRHFFSGWAENWPKWLAVIGIATPLLVGVSLLIQWLALRSERSTSGWGDEARREEEKGRDGRPLMQPASSDGDRDGVRRLVKSPAFGMIVAGILFWITIPLAFIIPWLDVVDADSIADHANLVISFGLAPLVLGTIMTIAGVRIKRLEGYGLAMTAAILPMILLAAKLIVMHSYRTLGMGPADFIAAPVGLWVLAVLARSDVRAAFNGGPHSDRAAAPPARRSNATSQAPAPRPLAVPLFGILNILAGVSLLMIVSASFMPWEEDKFNELLRAVTPGYDVLHTIERVMLPLHYLAAAGLFVAGVGLLMWKRWARTLAIAVCIFAIADFVIEAPVIVLGTLVPTFELATNPEYLAYMEFADADEAMTFALMLSCGMALIIFVSLTYHITQLVMLSRRKVVRAFEQLERDADADDETPRRGWGVGRVLIVLVIVFLGFTAMVAIPAVVAYLSLEQGPPTVAPAVEENGEGDTGDGGAGTGGGTGGDTGGDTEGDSDERANHEKPKTQQRDAGR